MSIATRRLIMLSRHSHRALTATRSTSTAVSDTPRFLKHNSPHPILTNHTSILSCPQTRLTTLPNGLRIATESNLSHSATVCVWIDTGSRFETDETRGVANFLMNMVFRGTSKRSMSDLDEEFENMGGEYKSYISREQTAYIAKVMTADVPKAIDILSDMLQNSTFEENMIVDLRNDTITRMLEENEDPESVVSDCLHAAAFRDTPFGRSTDGRPKDAFFVTKKVLQDYLATHYSTHRTIITASGAVNHEEIVEQVKKTFTKLSTNPVTSTQLVEQAPAIFTGSEIRKRDDDMPYAYFGIFFKGASWTDPDSFALLVIQLMLGSWTKSTDVDKHKGSQFAQMVGIDELAEHLRAATCHYKDTGLFGVCAIAKPDCLDDLAYAIMQKLSQLCYQVTEEDVIRAQNKLKYEFCKEQPRAEEIGRQLLAYGRRIPLAEMLARVDAVDVAAVKRVANRFIFDQDIAIASTGPVELLPDYNWLRGRTSMLHS
ncbi:putative peptidase M16, metalloenzyme, LuxS/M16 peptidase [Helianthus debilis subsp. tardiflorus]